MESYEPGMSSGKDAAEIYDDIPRRDELATVALLEEPAGDGPALERLRAYLSHPPTR